MRRLFTIMIMCIVALQSSKADNAITITKENTSVVISADECGPVRLAVDALCRDFGKVMGFKPEVKDGITGSGIELVVVNDATPSSRAFLPAETEGWGDNTFEAHRIKADGNRIYLHGMDMRGTIYAIYSFSEKFLGVPPLWYWCSWQPEHKDAVEVPAAYSYFQPSPTVRYRAWFPNDEDLFIPWRAKSSDNNELWLETMLRLKLNTVEHTATVTTDGTLNSEAQLYKKYGLVLTSHHMIALNNSFANWDAYWKEVRHTTASLGEGHGVAEGVLAVFHRRGEEQWGGESVAGVVPGKDRPALLVGVRRRAGV